MTRDEFEATVRKMQSENVPLTMANLMVRTELPRATIEDWLDGMQRDAKPARPKPARSADETGSKRAARVREGERDAGGDEDLVARARALRSEVLGDVVKSQLGIEAEARRSDRPRRSVKTGGIVGLVLPPAGLFYSAPYVEATVGTVAYVILAYVLYHIPFIGQNILLILHLLGGAAGAAYAWRFNRKGRRETLLPQRSGGGGGEDKG